MSVGVRLQQCVTIGGIEHYVRVRGTDVDHPLLLHGGPGFAEGPLFAAHNAEPEGHFWWCTGTSAVPAGRMHRAFRRNR